MWTIFVRTIFLSVPSRLWVSPYTPSGRLPIHDFFGPPPIGSSGCMSSPYPLLTSLLLPSFWQVQTVCDSQNIVCNPSNPIHPRLQDLFGIISCVIFSVIRCRRLSLWVMLPPSPAKYLSRHFSLRCLQCPAPCLCHGPRSTAVEYCWCHSG